MKPDTPMPPECLTTGRSRVAELPGVAGRDPASPNPRPRPSCLAEQPEGFRPAAALCSRGGAPPRGPRASQRVASARSREPPLNRDVRTACLSTLAPIAGSIAPDDESGPQARRSEPTPRATPAPLPTPPFPFRGGRRCSAVLNERTGSRPATTPYTWPSPCVGGSETGWGSSPADGTSDQRLGIPLS
jgi:hypothetical protein